MASSECNCHCDSEPGSESYYSVLTHDGKLPVVLLLVQHNVIVIIILSHGQ